MRARLTEAAPVLATRGAASETSIDEMLEAADVSSAALYVSFDPVPAVMAELAV
jgi:hypothetical protein